MFWLIIIANFKVNTDTEQHFNTKVYCHQLYLADGTMQSEKFNYQYLILNNHFCGL